MPPSDAQILALRETLERYAELPRHQADADFLRRLKYLQQWEVVDMRRRHVDACAEDSGYARVLDYYLRELHNGLPLDSMMARGPQGLEHTRRMDKSFALFAAAMEYSVLCAVLQDRMVMTLGEKPLTSRHYGEALRACDDESERLQRLDLLVEIGHLVTPHIRSRMIYTGFRLLKGMFRSLGLGDIHSALDAGFRQLRDVPRLSKVLAEIAATERSQLRTMQS